ncbi:HAD-IA family hydrolase [Streptomyces sp. NPDC051597]|uniref:HAD family hydrolase n=1 Tax=Streptomyces sp. NPDC051597 TaxID=3155049 RepID=UPI00344183CF
MDDPHDLLDAAQCVIFDFDGPVCDLFAKYTAADVVDDLRAWLERDLDVRVPPGKYAADPLGYLGLVEQSPHGRRWVRELEKRLTQQEERAAESAEPTEGAADLIRELGAVETRLGIATNNSAEAVGAYLRRMDLTDSFGAHVHGRGADIAKLKPDPDCLRRALGSTGSAPGESVMIGDSEKDLDAANRLEVPFIAFVPTGKSRESGEQDSEGRWYERVPVVESLHELLSR